MLCIAYLCCDTQLCYPHMSMGLLLHGFTLRRRTILVSLVTAFGPRHTNPHVAPPSPPPQAMALSHSEGVIEVACNLLEPWVSPPQVRTTCCWLL